MQEYSTTVKSTDVGLPWESHFLAKRQFEVIFLNYILTILLLMPISNN